MEKFICPKCGRISYTANRELVNICPHCSFEKYLILSPKFLSGYELSDIKIIVDRRKNSEPVPFERRKGEEAIPIAWLIVKKKDTVDSPQDSDFISM
jgi:predicted  nucleic acid-binding Zn-ribbon protein